MSRAEEIWARKSDEEVQTAVVCLDQYTEEGRRVILRELERRGLVRTGHRNALGGDRSAQAGDSGQQTSQELYAFVAEQTKAGLDESMIAEKLVAIGVSLDDAHHVIGAVHDYILNVAKREQVTPASLGPAAVAALAAAVFGGAAWGAIVLGTGSEIGYMATGIGVLVGYAVVLITGGRKGFPLQVIAAVASLLGITVGKYLTFLYYLRRAVEEKQGPDAAASISVFSGRVVAYFLDNLNSLLSGYDVLWAVLALLAAWRIPRSLAVNLAPYERVP